MKKKKKKRKGSLKQNLMVLIKKKCSQFTVVLNGIICFSVRFCDNSLLVLKMHFQDFSFASKKYKAFPVT